MTFLAWCGRYSRKHPQFDPEVWRFCCEWVMRPTSNKRKRRPPRDFWDVRCWLTGTGRCDLVPAACEAWRLWSGRPVPSYLRSTVAWRHP